MDLVDSTLMPHVGLAPGSLLVFEPAVEVVQLLLVTVDRATESFDPLLQSPGVPGPEADGRPSADVAADVQMRGSR
jgi:hypothetical protein